MKIRDKKLLLPLHLHRAIERYFLVKASHGGMFIHGEKEPLCAAIVEAAGMNIGVTIVPGLVILTDSKGRTAWVNSSITSPEFSPILKFSIRESAGLP